MFAWVAEIGIQEQSYQIICSQPLYNVEPFLEKALDKRAFFWYYAFCKGSLPFAKRFFTFEVSTASDIISLILPVKLDY